MAVRAFTMPKWGIEMRTGTVSQWCVVEGETVCKGQTVAVIETDKINNEVEAESPGILKRIVVQEGETVPVGALLAVFGDEDDQAGAVEALIASFGRPTAGGEPGTIPQSENPGSVAISPEARRLADSLAIDVAQLGRGSGRGGRITFQDIDQARRPAPVLSRRTPVSNAVDTEALDIYYASPMAKRLALRHNVQLAGLKGTGPRGRISKGDVLAQIVPRAAETRGMAPAAYEIVPMSAIRKTIARRLTEAKQTIPHFYLRREIAIERLLAYRASVRAKVSLNDLIVRAVALALVEVPDVNIQVHDETIRRYAEPEIAFAVATDRGLMTPIIRAAHRLPLDALSVAIKDLIEKARTGRLARADLDGGTFTISNLGMFGIDQFDAIINPPQGAILAVGAARRLWTEGGSGLGQFQSRLGISLSCDHRAIDGVTGARFLEALAALVEAPERLAAGNDE
jgi:pyruvate dehydrogenase E2 component (dihydrolipoamide acetyltransferase)